MSAHLSTRKSRLVWLLPQVQRLFFEDRFSHMISLALQYPRSGKETGQEQLPFLVLH
jgi:hypothetical protein